MTDLSDGSVTEVACFVLVDENAIVTLFGDICIFTYSHLRILHPILFPYIDARVLRNARCIWRSKSGLIVRKRPLKR